MHLILAVTRLDWAARPRQTTAPATSTEGIRHAPRRRASDGTGRPRLAAYLSGLCPVALAARAVPRHANRTDPPAVAQPDARVAAAGRAAVPANVVSPAGAR